MKNFVKRIEEDVRSGGGLKRSRNRVENIAENPGCTVIHRKKRKLVSSSQDIQDLQKKNCIPEKAVEAEERNRTSCMKCGKKLKIASNYDCRCGNVYCIRHKFYDQHGCTFDYKAAAIAKLEAQNQKIVSRKIGDIL